MVGSDLFQVGIDNLLGPIECFEDDSLASDSCIIEVARLLIFVEVVKHLVSKDLAF